MMADLSYLLLTLIIVMLIWIIWYIASAPYMNEIKENLVTNSPQLISSYNDDWFYPSDKSYADYIKLPFMYF